MDSYLPWVKSDTVSQGPCKVRQLFRYAANLRNLRRSARAQPHSSVRLDQRPTSAVNYQRVMYAHPSSQILRAGDQRFP